MKSIEIRVIPCVKRHDTHYIIGDAVSTSYNMLPEEDSAEFEQRVMRVAEFFRKASADGTNGGLYGMCVIVRPQYAAYEWRSFCKGEFEFCDFRVMMSADIGVEADAPWWFDHRD